MLAMWPSLPGFKLEEVNLVDDEYVLVARSNTAVSRCPICKQQSESVHSWYERRPADLPSCGIVVRLYLQVRRFFCRNPGCSQRIFCERLPQLIFKYARRTIRLAESLTLLAFGLGGIGGERTVPRIGMPASRDTLLRLIRRQADPQRPEPRVIGVDDWAFRKRHTYGTLLCDLEQGFVIDLLPDREAETLAGWLKAQQSIEIVARDRSKTYKAGIDAGAPAAIQVADRWHLASNLVDALETTLARHPSCLLGEVTQEKPAAAKRETLSEANSRRTVKADMLAAREARRALRLAQYDQITKLKQCGVTYAGIAAQVGLSVPTVKRWLAYGAFPERKPRAVQPTKLDPYYAYAIERWREGCHNLAQIHREIRQQGYTGTYSAVYQRCRDLRTKPREEPASSPSAGRLPQPRRRYSPRQAAFLFIQQADKLSDEQQADLELMLTENPQFARWQELVQQFMSLLREHDLARLTAWLDAVNEHGSGPMKRFAAGLREDYPEVAAALTHKWSNGATEGFINRLKLLKRAMYGRAKLDLLRKRIMHRI
jgi:transposase